MQIFHSSTPSLIGMMFTQLGATLTCFRLLHQSSYGSWHPEATTNTASIRRFMVCHKPIMSYLKRLLFALSVRRSVLSLLRCIWRALVSIKERSCPICERVLGYWSVYPIPTVSLPFRAVL